MGESVPEPAGGVPRGAATDRAAQEIQLAQPHGAGLHHLESKSHAPPSIRTAPVSNSPSTPKKIRAATDCTRMTVKTAGTNTKAASPWCSPMPPNNTPLGSTAGGATAVQSGPCLCLCLVAGDH